jgi:lipopolysaccharide/colanic/teichoic acid biosynthesis glycosyltransferase
MSQEHTPSSGVDRVLQRLCDASATIGGVVLVAIASVTVVSVIGRAFFSHLG